MRLLFAFPLCFLWTLNVFANDSTAELAVGGLRLTQSDAVSLDKEDLYISRDEVRVDYVFTNTSGKDVETLVAFPLPEQGFPDGEDSAIYDLGKDLEFKTLVDGKAVDYKIVTQAVMNGEDITSLLDKVGLRINAQWKDGVKPDATLATRDIAARDKLLALGAFKNEGTPAEPFYMQQWTVQTSVTRSQVFKAGATVKVQHRYKPLVGGSVAGNLSPEYRKEEWAKQHLAKYCIEDSWIKSFDRELPKHATESNPTGYNEIWLGYVLKSGANWKGPIRDFRLVVDKGQPDSLVSFCAEGVKKISPTQFEIKKRDFEPTQDLNVLIVDWWKPN